MIDEKQTIQQIQQGGLTPVRRLSNRRVIYQVGDRFPIYNRKSKKIDGYSTDGVGFGVGDLVHWFTTNGRLYKGQIVYEMPVGERIENVAQTGKFDRYNVRPILSLSPRGYVSYVVAVRGKAGEIETLYWPSTSRLRKGLQPIAKRR